MMVTLRVKEQGLPPLFVEGETIISSKRTIAFRLKIGTITPKGLSLRGEAETKKLKNKIMKIDTIIFDLGGVLIDWNPERLFKKIFDDEKEMKYFLREICTPDWNEEQDGGRPIAEATALLVDQFPDYSEQIKAFYGRWTEMLGGAIEGTVEILKELKAADTHRIYALTNWSAETFPIALELYDFLQLFEGILVSGTEKLKKPDPKIYHLILDRYKIEGAKSIFIDDNLRNIKASIDCGINGIHFTSPEQLRADLKTYDILQK